ncbi:hypothetical protein FA95DRAFT_1482424 [Auriscalpium vulgare]|uniref:Uncharacterized protein n=1 Tax=Auriscalpium vulgare TaxID=40419 RepID=A0ACB8SAQ3_9AGAM|nr:hypothetical protein FA95DRAFT_1482424 [Auriscalpium vulgare]
MCTTESHYVDASLLSTDSYIASALVRQGFAPCAPLKPTVAIAFQALELFRVAHLRCAHLSIQAFVKTLSDLQGVPFRRYLARQFSIAFDLFQDIRSRVARRVQRALERDAPDWRLRHACPACTYKLEGEENLPFSMLFTMDGNDSLKRILRRGAPPSSSTDDAPVVGPVIERIDTRQHDNDYYLARGVVDRWANLAFEDLPPAEGTAAATTGDAAGDGGDTAGNDDANPCEERWRNMASDITKKMWGIFDETGIFLSLCRHGFALLILDMVQSGELSKYGFATVEKLLNTFGAGLGGGYDIGCKFGTSINNSALGPLARSLSYQSLVGAFHGYAHNRKCQLKNLAKYKTNLGLEDLEGCERAFSRSNPLAASTRYASAFHRQQDIATHYEHADNLEVYANLSDFLCNNYKQALSILSTAPSILADTMKQLGIADRGVFATWLSQERTYLEGLKSEPTEETQEMEYYQSLVHMQGSEEKLLEAREAWAILTPQTIDSAGSLRKTETARRQAIARNVKAIEVVDELELRMGIKDRWLPKGVPWLRAQKKVALRTYRKAVDALEALVVARIFELSKMNMAQTGYKLRKHIAKALQARSQAVRTAVDRYNNAATALRPPRRALQWADVIEYAFLSDFDLLRDARQDVSKQMWATPVGRVALDQHFTILRAEEEIVRLNVEIPRVVTYIRDEGAYLRQRVIDVRSEDPHLAHQITLFSQERGRFNEHHLRKFAMLTHLVGFTGSISPGVSRQRRDRAAGDGGGAGLSALRRDGVGHVGEGRDGGGAGAEGGGVEGRSGGDDGSGRDDNRRGRDDRRGAVGADLPVREIRLGDSAGRISGAVGSERDGLPLPEARADIHKSRRAKGSYCVKRAGPPKPSN